MQACLKIGVTLVIFFLSFFSAHGQSAWLTQPVTIDAKNIPLREVLDDLESQTDGFSFSYNPSTIPLRAWVTYQARSKPLFEVLEYLVDQYRMSYSETE